MTVFKHSVNICELEILSNTDKNDVSWCVSSKFGGTSYLELLKNTGNEFVLLYFHSYSASLWGTFFALCRHDWVTAKLALTLLLQVTQGNFNISLACYIFCEYTRNGETVKHCPVIFAI